MSLGILKNGFLETIAVTKDCNDTSRHINKIGDDPADLQILIQYLKTIYPDFVLQKGVTISAIQNDPSYKEGSYFVHDPDANEINHITKRNQEQTYYFGITWGVPSFVDVINVWGFIRCSDNFTKQIMPYDSGYNMGLGEFLKPGGFFGTLNKSNDNLKSEELSDSDFNDDSDSEIEQKYIRNALKRIHSVDTFPDDIKRQVIDGSDNQLPGKYAVFDNNPDQIFKKHSKILKQKSFIVRCAVPVNKHDTTVSDIQDMIDEIMCQSYINDNNLAVICFSDHSHDLWKDRFYGASIDFYHNLKYATNGSEFDDCDLMVFDFSDNHPKEFLTYFEILKNLIDNYNNNMQNKKIIIIANKNSMFYNFFPEYCPALATLPFLDIQF